MDDVKSPALVFYADDQYINLQAMKLNFEDIELQKEANDRKIELQTFPNGQEVADSIDGLLENLVANPSTNFV